MILSVRKVMVVSHCVVGVEGFPGFSQSPLGGHQGKFVDVSGHCPSGYGHLVALDLADFGSPDLS
jgi:hypothetical protein